MLPGITHWQSPGWFAYFPANASPPSILAELAAAGIGAQGMLWSTSPALTEIESTVLDWLVDLLGLPPAWRTDTGPGGGVIQMSASDSTHLVHVVARERAIARGRGRPTALVAYGSSQAHSSVERGARVAGLRATCGCSMSTSAFALRPDALAGGDRRGSRRRPHAGDRHERHRHDRRRARWTRSPRSREIAAAAGLWHHVDAAWAGSAMLLPEQRRHQAGAELADSYTFNPHKWLFTNFDCNVLWVADRAPLIETLSIVPPYLRNAASESGAVIDYRDWHVPLGRRFRALKLWWVLRSYGAAGLRDAARASTSRWQPSSGARVDAHPRWSASRRSPSRWSASATATATRPPTRSPTRSTPAPTLYVTPSMVDGDALRPRRRSARRARRAPTSSACGA